MGSKLKHDPWDSSFAVIRFVLRVTSVRWQKWQGLKGRWGKNNGVTKKGGWFKRPGKLRWYQIGGLHVEGVQGDKCFRVVLGRETSVEYGLLRAPHCARGHSVSDRKGLHDVRILTEVQKKRKKNGPGVYTQLRQWSYKEKNYKES